MPGPDAVATRKLVRDGAPARARGAPVSANRRRLTRPGCTFRGDRSHDCWFQLDGHTGEPTAGAEVRQQARRRRVLLKRSHSALLAAGCSAGTRTRAFGHGACDLLALGIREFRFPAAFAEEHEPAVEELLLARRGGGTVKAGAGPGAHPTRPSAMARDSRSRISGSASPENSGMAVNLGNQCRRGVAFIGFAVVLAEHRRYQRGC